MLAGGATVEETKGLREGGRDWSYRVSSFEGSRKGKSHVLLSAATLPVPPPRPPPASVRSTNSFKVCHLQVFDYCWRALSSDRLQG